MSAPLQLNPIEQAFKLMEETINNHSQQEKTFMNTSNPLNKNIIEWCDQFNNNTYNITAKPDNNIILFTTTVTIVDIENFTVELYTQTIKDTWKENYKTDCNSKIFHENITVSTTQPDNNTITIHVHLQSDHEQLLPPEITAGILDTINTTLVCNTRKAVEKVDVTKEKFKNKIRELKELSVFADKETTETFGTNMTYNPTGVYKEIIDLLKKLETTIAKL